MNEKFVYVNYFYNKQIALCKYKGNLRLRSGLIIIANSVHGNEPAEILPNHMRIDTLKDLNINEVSEIVRIANSKDIARIKQNEQKALKWVDDTKEKIKKHDLPIRLVNIYFFFEAKKVLFNFFL